MINAGIYDRDIAVLRSQPTFNDGDIAAVIVDEEATLKRVFHAGKGLRLHPEMRLTPTELFPPLKWVDPVGSRALHPPLLAYVGTETQR